MSRLDDVRAFYEILDNLRGRLGGARFLNGSHGSMPWPARGVYFFFEEGEERTTSGSGPRVVRVGTHALTATSKTTLWNRLSQHRGTAATGGGNHRGSIFRLLVGEALGRRDRIVPSSWGRGSSASAAATACGLAATLVKEQERPIEGVVSQIIGAMPFLWIDADPPGGGTALRAMIERNAIALLSNVDRSPIDPPSSRWLGHHSGRELVRTSGLWNNDHVEKHHDAGFLDAFAAAVRSTSTTDCG